IVLTAGHCVSGVGFTPRYFQFEDIFGIRRYDIQTWYTVNGQWGHWNPRQWGSDWALLVLSDPVKDREPLVVDGFMTNQEIQSLAGNLTVIGYSADLNNAHF